MLSIAFGVVGVVAVVVGALFGLSCVAYSGLTVAAVAARAAVACCLWL